MARALSAPCSKTCAGAPVEAEALVARARRLGVDLAAGAVALRVSTRAPHGLRAAAAVRDVAPGGLLLRRGYELDALLPGERAGAEGRAQAIVVRLSSHAAVGFSSQTSRRLGACTKRYARPTTAPASSAPSAPTCPMAPT
jgi:hypothetical protein